MHNMARWHRRYLVGVLTAACLAMSLVATGATSATAATTYGAGGGAYATSALKPTMSLVATGATSATAATTYGAGGGAYATPSALKPPAGCRFIQPGQRARWSCSIRQRLFEHWRTDGLGHDFQQWCAVQWLPGCETVL